MVPAQTAGRIVELIRRDGAEVQRGELLVRLDDRNALARQTVAELELAIAAQQARNRTRYKAALEASGLEDLEYDSSMQLFGRKVVARLEHERERTESELARIKIEEAQLESARDELVRQLREAELQLARIDVSDHQVAAPYDGVIVEFFHRVGDWVQPEQPVLRLLRMDRLKVETFLDAETVPPHEAFGRAVTVRIQLPAGATRTIEGCRIDYVCPELEPGGEYRVWCEVPNVRQPRGDADAQWLLRPGATAELLIQRSIDDRQKGDGRLVSTLDDR